LEDGRFADPCHLSKSISRRWSWLIRFLTHFVATSGSAKTSTQLQVGLMQNSFFSFFEHSPTRRPQKRNVGLLGIQIIFLAFVMFRFWPQNMEHPENMDNQFYPPPFNWEIAGPIAAVLN
jgi:hypothetical protein